MDNGAEERTQLLRDIHKSIVGLTRSTERNTAKLAEVDKSIQNVDRRVGKLELAVVRIDKRHARENGAVQTKQSFKHNIGWILATIVSLFAIMSFLFEFFPE